MFTSLMHPAVGKVHLNIYAVNNMITGKLHLYTLSVRAHLNSYLQHGKKVAQPNRSPKVYPVNKTKSNFWVSVWEA